MDVHTGGVHEKIHADETHIVGQRHPAEGVVRTRQACSLHNAAQVGDEVAVGEHHPLGFAGGARRKLDEGSVVGGGNEQVCVVRKTVDFVHEKGARPQCGHGGLFTRFTTEGFQTLQRLAVGVEPRVAQLLRNSQQLVLVLVADAGGYWHGHQAAGKAGPIAVEELFVVGEVEDDRVATPRATLLQQVQQAQGTLVEFRERDFTRAVAALVMEDGTVELRVVAENLVQRVREVHGVFLKCTRKRSGRKARKLTAASMGMGPSSRYSRR